MAEIKFNIPDAKLQRVIDAINWRFPKADGFTEAQWAKECIRRMIKEWDYEKRQATYTESSPVIPDNDIAS